ncbi:MAG: hypothetical protein ABI600_14930 [Luteolibacter sp.]
MNTSLFKTCGALSFIFLTSSDLHAVGLTLPANDPLIQGDLNPPAEPELTPAELAIPPVGQIQKSHLRTVNQLRTILATTLATVAAGAGGQGSPWFAKAQAYKAGLDTISTSSLQADCIALIPKIADLLTGRKEVYEGQNVPKFALQSANLANGFSTVLIHAIERHVVDQNGNVSAVNLINFITVFSNAGFLSEGDWEESRIPIDAAGIMILDAAAVVTHLKTRPWQEADQFLGNNTAAEAFARYAVSGNGMAVLKTKYAANQATITAKWNELAAWVVTQRPPN